MTATALQTTTERIESNKVKLRVEVQESALRPAVDAAYRRWANEIRIDGFRKGKIPRRLIDARVGSETVRQEALNEALPDLYVEALRAEDLEAIAPPEIEIVKFEEGAPLVFEATVDLRPEIELPDLKSLEVEAPSPEVTDEDVDEQLERLRERFAELETVGREARRGDFVLIDLKGYRSGELVEGVGAPDLLHEIGSQRGPAKLDAELEGNRPGSILKFNDVAPEGTPAAGEEISFTVLLKEVKARKLPPLDDEFAKSAGGRDTLEELRSELRDRLAVYKRQMVAEQVRALTLEALVQASDLEAPEVLVSEEFEHRLHHLEEDLARAGMSVEQYAAQLDQTELELRSELRQQVVASVKAELLLEEIARREDIRVDDEDLGREVAYLAARSDADPNDVAKQLASSGRLRTLVADIMRRKALDHVVRQLDIEGFELSEPADEEPGPSAEPPNQQAEQADS